MQRFIRVVRNYSSVSMSQQRPELHGVFPQKRMINRILFELDSKHTLRKLYPVYDSIYKDMQKGIDSKVPKGISPSDLMIMKKVLEKIRNRTKNINPHLLALENALLDKSAELGNNDAISLLAFDVLKHPEHNSLEDVDHGKKLIKMLYQQNHHLTIKLLGDFSLKYGNYSEALKYYLKFLELEDRTFLAGEVYGKLGEINFRKPNLQMAEQFFLKSIKLTPLEYSVHSYFYLAQIYMSSDPLKARALMENCATQGFRESFKTLGFLEMNYFGDFRKAQEWFRLGSELFQLECFMGFFDCCTELEDWTEANKCYKDILRLQDTNTRYKEAIDRFLTNRQIEVTEARKYSFKPFTDSKTFEQATKTDPIISKENKWEL